MLSGTYEGRRDSGRGELGSDRVPRRRFGPCGSLAAAGLLALALTGCSPDPAADAHAETGGATASSQGRVQVSALGRLEPGEGVIEISAQPGARVARIEVEEGDDVSATDLLVVLDDWDERKAGVNAIRTAVKEAHIRRDRQRVVGPLEVSASVAAHRAAAAELTLQEAQLDRMRSLEGQDVYSVQAYDQQGAATQRAQAAERQAQSELDALRGDVEFANAETEAALELAQNRLATALAQLARSEIRTPTAARVLKIFRRPGEVVADTPMLLLGETERMYAVAEVFETDIRFVKIGQRATVTSEAFPEQLSGRVERGGRIVHKNDVLGLDPGKAADARIIEVRIRLGDSKVASRFVHHQVDVAIDTASD